jgi:putative transposase
MTSGGEHVGSSKARRASQPVWDKAVARFAVVARLAEMSTLHRGTMEEEAGTLGISVRYLYLLVKRYRDGESRGPDVLLPRVSAGGRGVSRLAEPVEALIEDFIRRRYLSRPPIPISTLHAEIADACLQHGLPAPARGTVAHRIAQKDPVMVGRRRRGENAVRSLRSAGGSTPKEQGPLRKVEIDHTPTDLIVVDEAERKEIGRPYLTVAIDRYSRCIVGMVLSLEAPSSVTVGLCLAHMATDKQPALDAMGIDVVWPMSGKPLGLYLDNAPEFKSHALERGCEQHGITLQYRPVGQPQYGGTVERVIGTIMRMVHELPGTTFSNTAERGQYPSQKRAALTMRELERWLVLAIGRYHGSIHRSLGTTPAARWVHGVNDFGATPLVGDPIAFLLDFLPGIRRSINRDGFVVDHIHYFSAALNPWINRRESLPPFLLRRDPRDVSRVWVEDPKDGSFIELPSMSQEPVSLWEHRAAVKRQREEGRGAVDEAAIARLRAEMRQLAKEAVVTTRASRRAAERTPAVRRGSQPRTVEPPTTSTINDASIQPFDEREQW